VGKDGVTQQRAQQRVRSLARKYLGRMEHGWRLMRDDVPAPAISLVHPTFAPFGVSPALPLRFQKPSCGKSRRPCGCSRSHREFQRDSTPTMWAVEPSAPGRSRPNPYRRMAVEEGVAAHRPRTVPGRVRRNAASYLRAATTSTCLSRPRPVPRCPTVGRQPV
jgi:hypothetical protein